MYCRLVRRENNSVTKSDKNSGKIGFSPLLFAFWAPRWPYLWGLFKDGAVHEPQWLAKKRRRTLASGNPAKGKFTFMN
jgi:hypothetical protein